MPSVKHTIEFREIIRRMRDDLGLSNKEIGEKLGLKPHAIRGILSTFKSTVTRHRTKGPTEERKCLCCAKPFQSEWKGNRICFNCKTSESRRSGMFSNECGRERRMASHRGSSG